MATLKVKVSFTDSMLETRGLLKFGGLFGEDLYLSSCWSSLAARIDISGRIDLVAEMATDEKRIMRSNNFCVPSPLLYFS